MHTHTLCSASYRCHHAKQRQFQKHDVVRGRVRSVRRRQPRLLRWSSVCAARRILFPVSALRQHGDSRRGSNRAHGFSCVVRCELTFVGHCYAFTVAGPTTEASQCEHPQHVFDPHSKSCCAPPVRRRHVCLFVQRVARADVVSVDMTEMRAATPAGDRRIPVLLPGTVQGANHDVGCLLSRVCL